MLKGRGFTIIEILTTITILVIVATIAAPEYWRWKDRDDYRAEGQAFFDTILDARGAALTNKLCNNGNPSTKWRVIFDSNISPPRYRVHCHWDNSGVSVVEKTTVIMQNSEIELIDFNGSATPAPMAGVDLPDNVQISFFSGGVSGRLEYNDGSIHKEEKVQIVIGHDDSDYEHTICFNRVAGFPTFNKTGNTCQDY